MAETLKFVYVLILFISLFLVLIVCDSAFVANTETCITDKDCPNGRNYIGRCRKGHCQQRLVR
ncbi:Nodule Cysteine-Rich (NCR) secreted peptide [Medicago truncatula]|uniref:Nodule Cysteine-Rich (NCR) secreted peptide n=2 Tax=Medicago truncatula TaxID=3880 RepID=G7KYR1_MEDTR|nr:Nodule Cysteine-Rich (NCR) secreted peptide [Medicago truncatula]